MLTPLFSSRRHHDRAQLRDPDPIGQGARPAQRPDASSAHQQVLRLISFKRPAIRVFDADGHSVSLEKLRRLAVQEAVRPGKGSKAPAGF
jgi:hypothetical protein